MEKILSPSVLHLILIFCLCLSSCSEKNQAKKIEGLSEPLHTTEEVVRFLFSETGLKREEYKFLSFYYDYVKGYWRIIILPIDREKMPPPGTTEYIIENKEIMRLEHLMEG